MSGIKNGEVADLLEVYTKTYFKCLWTVNELGWAGVVLQKIKLTALRLFLLYQQKGVSIMEMFTPFLHQSLNVAVMISFFSDGTWRRWSVLFWVYTFY